MKNMKKILALVLAALMLLSMTAAFAATDPTTKITIQDQNNVTVAGQTFTAYKLFDVSYQDTSNPADGTNDAWSYYLSTSSPFYSEALVGASQPASGMAKVLWDNFTFKAIPGDSSKVTVALKGTNNEAHARQIADAMQQYLAAITNTSYVKSATAGDDATSVVIDLDNIGPGYYLVTGTAKPKNDYDDTNNATLVAAVILTTNDPTATLNVKADAPELNKAITAVKEDGTNADSTAILDDAGKAAVAKIGTTVEFTLTSAVPNLNGYTDYTYTIADTMSAGLSFTGTDTANVINGMVVKIGTTELTLNGTNDKAKYTLTHTVGSKNFELTIPYSTLNAFNTSTAITVVYPAIVNNSALTYDKEINSAHLEYTHSPYDDETNETPEKKVYIIDINLDALKVDLNDTNKKLDGATFKLYRVKTDNSKEYYKWDTANNKVTWVSSIDNGDAFVTDTTGHLEQVIRGLDKGTYYLVETIAPSGYSLPSSDFQIDINVNEANNQVTYTVTYAGESATVENSPIDLTTAQQGSQATAGQPEATGTIANTKGTELPSTGGIGTTLFYVGGGILVLLAVVMLVTKRRMTGND